MPIRQSNQALMATGVLAAAAFLALYVPNRDDTGGAIVGAALTFVASAIGFAAVARVRPMPKRPLREQARLMGLSLMMGTALGLVNLTANYSIASLDSRICWERDMNVWSMAAVAWVGGAVVPQVAQEKERLDVRSYWQDAGRRRSAGRPDCDPTCRYHGHAGVSLLRGSERPDGR
jgi:hypothetical protein